MIMIRKIIFINFIQVPKRYQSEPTLNEENKK